MGNAQKGFAIMASFEWFCGRIKSVLLLNNNNKSYLIKAKYVLKKQRQSKRKQLF